MKKLLALLLFPLASLSLNAQSDTLFLEDFNSPNWKMTTSVSPSIVPPSQQNLFWRDTVVTKNSVGGPATDTVGNRTLAHLTTPMISIRDGLGFLHPNMRFQFDQICYIDWFDQAWVEYKLGDSVWTKFPNIVTINNVSNWPIYLGPSNYLGPTDSANNLSNAPYHYFTKLSGANDIWRNLDSAFIFTPSNSPNRWVQEVFDVSRLISWETSENNFPINTVDSIQFRLSLYDNPASPVGRSGLHQWWIDNVLFLKGLTIGIEERDLANVKISPNPASNQIQLIGLESEKVDYLIYNIAGQKLKQGQLSRNGQIAIDQLPNGVYFLHIELNTEVETLKFIKH